MQVFVNIALGLWPTVRSFFEKYRKLALALFIIVLSVMIVVFIQGCGSVPTSSPDQMSKEIYKKDLRVTVDNISYYGIGVLPNKSVYDIIINPSEKADRIIIQSCSRDVTLDKPKTGWFSNKVTYKYIPIQGRETGINCPLEIASVNKDKKNSFAYLEFEDTRKEVSLDANLQCNGEFSKPKGVGICQTAVGLRQGIFFQTKVVSESIGDGCDFMETKDGFFWEWDAIPGECEIYFTAREKHSNGKRLVFRLGAIGYTSVPYKD